MPRASAARRALSGWGPALGLAAIVLVSKGIVLGLLAPRLVAAPSAAEAWCDPTLPGECSPGGPDVEALVERYRPQATPALTARMDELARRLGSPEGSPDTPLRMLRTLIEDDRAIPPGLLLPEAPPEVLAVCSEPGDGYLCLMIAMHLQAMSEGEAWVGEP